MRIKSPEHDLYRKISKILLENLTAREHTRLIGSGGSSRASPRICMFARSLANTARCSSRSWGTANFALVVSLAHSAVVASAVGSPEMSKFGSNPTLRSLARRAGSGAGAALGFASMSVPFGRFVPAPALSAIGKAWSVAVAVSSLRPASAAASVPSTVRMMSGWKGGASSSRPRRSGGNDKRSQPDAGWGNVPDQGSGGWGGGDSGGWDDDAGGGDRRGSLEGGGGGRDGGRGLRARGGGGGRGRGGSMGDRDGGSFRGGRGGRGARGGRGGGMRPDRSDETREEMFERQREYQAQQAERKSWLEEQNVSLPSYVYI